MFVSEFCQLIQEGKRPVIRFNSDAGSFEGYPESGMRARVLSALFADDCWSVQVSYEEFDTYNREFESANYYGRGGTPCLTAREAGCYKVRESLYLPAEGELVGFEAEPEEALQLYGEYRAQQPGMSYVSWLEQRLMNAKPRETSAGNGGRSHKQVLAMRKDLKMRVGKLAAQAAHASLAALLSRARRIDQGGEPGLFIPLDGDIGPWLDGHFTKIALGVASEEEARALFDKASALGIPCALIEDSGLTEFKGQPTVTGVSIGPAEAELVNQVTGHLPLNL